MRREFFGNIALRARCFGVLLALLPMAAQAFPPVQDVTAKSGTHAWLMEYHDVPVCAATVTFRDGGSASDPQDKQGRALMVSRLLSEGAGDLDAKSFGQMLEDHAIQLSFEVDEDHFSASIYALREGCEKAFDLLALALKQPRFDAPAIERARAQTQSELVRLEQEPAYVADRQWRKLIFGGHPYGRVMRGDKESLDRLGKDDFTAYARRYFTRGNMIVAAAGDLNAQTLAGWMERHFASLPERFVPESEIAPAAIAPHGEERHVERDVPQSAVVFGMQGIPRDDPDYYAAYVLNHAIGGGSLTSLLTEELREKGGMVYAVESKLDPMLRGALWRGAFATRTDQVPLATQKLRSIIAHIYQNGVAQPVLDDAKRYLVGSFPLQLDNTQKIANFLINMQLYHLGMDYLQKRDAWIQAVSVQDVRRVAKRLLDPAALRIVTVGRAAAQQPPAKPKAVP